MFSHIELGDLHRSFTVISDHQNVKDLTTKYSE